MRLSESVRHWLKAQFPWKEMKALDKETIAQLARDNAMSVSDFSALANSKSGNSELLPRQLTRAGLNPETVADAKSSVMRDMQIVLRLLYDPPLPARAEPTEFSAKLLSVLSQRAHHRRIETRSGIINRPPLMRVKAT